MSDLACVGVGIGILLFLLVVVRVAMGATYRLEAFIEGRWQIITHGTTWKLAKLWAKDTGHRTRVYDYKGRRYYNL